MRQFRINFSTTIVLLSLVFLTLPARATDFIIIVQDGAGTGFNDTTPRAPVGGNPGTTLGQQRLNVLQRAGDIWAGYLHSEVPIRVQAQFQDYGGDANGVVLAGASAVSVQVGFANAPQAGVLYPVALANSLAGTDLSTSNDINVTINIALDEDPLLDDWYYGLDGNAPSDTIDMLDVLLHELGHGLGMVSFVGLNNGAFNLNIPDVYSLYLFDTETQKGWGEMNNPERKNSSKNDPNLTWAGPYTTAAYRHILEPERSIEVGAPPVIAGLYDYVAASYGPAVPSEGITGELVVVDDGVAPATDACDTLLNAADLVGKIAYIDRGSCNFDSKTLKAQLAGAIAVIIANNVTGGPAGMSGNAVVDGIPLTIPTVSISMEDGFLLSSESPGVQLSIGVPGDAYAGTSGGFVRIYAPNPVEGGSSVSHWSTSASPDLLMEPFINPVLREDLDLSLTQMKDIGWQVIDIPYPYLSYTLWVDETFDAAATLTAEGDDPDGDSATNIEEYFFGGDPEVPSTAILPRMQLTDPDLEFTYTRTKLAADLAYAYEVSPDMFTWTDAVVDIDYTEEVITDLGTSAEQVQLKLVPPASGEKVFVRLRITIP